MDFNDILRVCSIGQNCLPLKQAWCQDRGKHSEIPLQTMCKLLFALLTKTFRKHYRIKFNLLTGMEESYQVMIYTYSAKKHCTKEKSNENIACKSTCHICILYPKNANSFRLSIPEKKNIVITMKILNTLTWIDFIRICVKTGDKGRYRGSWPIDKNTPRV